GAIVTSATASLAVLPSRARTGSSAARAGSAAATSSRAGASRRIHGDAVTADSAGRDHLRRREIARACTRVLGKWHPLDALAAVAGQADQPQRVVRQPADLAHADVAQDLGADAEVAEDARARRREPGARGLRAPTLGDVEELEAASGAPEIEDHPAALRRDPLHRTVHQRTGVARRIPEDVTRQVFEMRA